MPDTDLRARIITALEAAGLAHRETTLPVRAGGGTFSVTGSLSTGADVSCEWWDATAGELAALRRRITSALQDAGFEVHEEPGRLCVPPEDRAGP